MSEYSFKPDVVVGEEGEDFIINYLTDSFGAKLITKRKDYKWDFQMEFNGNILTYETKTDVYCIPDTVIEGRRIKGRDSGNIFIEYECRGKESGIRVTQADWFVTYFKFLHEIWFISVPKLKELISCTEFPIGVGGDPGSFSTGYLIPRSEFRKHFIVKNV